MIPSRLARALGGLLVDAGQRLLLRADYSPGKTVYPLSVSVREIPMEPVAGVAPFDTREAAVFNRARLAHLASLGLPLEGRSVLELGCGVGHLTGFFLERGCAVTALDGRGKNVEAFRARHPGVAAHVGDAEQLLSGFGRFDVVFCYGLLYHLTDQFRALRNMAEVCGDLLLLETVVCDHILPVTHLDDEHLSATQALHGLGQKPSPSAVVLMLSRAGFKFIYAPKQPPDDPDFRFEWRNSLEFRRAGTLMRCVFVASRKRFANPRLTPLLD